MRYTLRLPLVALLLFLPMALARAQQMNTANSNYRIYDPAGKSATLDQVLAACAANDVVFVGETHNDRTAHLIEQQLLTGAYTRLANQQHDPRQLTLSLEMFERDVQIVLDEYLNDLITERQFLASSRPWNNYESDYRPLVEFARTHRLPVVAANAPERYVNRVGRLGRESLRALSPVALSWLAPLPYGQPTATYAAKFQEAMSGGGQMQAHANPYLLDAQVLRDATMAYSIAERLKAQKHALVLQVNGNFHSDNRLGTVEQLHALRPQARVLVISITPGDPNTTDAKQWAGLGDFVFVTAASTSGSF